MHEQRKTKKKTKQETMVENYKTTAAKRRERTETKN